MNDLERARAAREERHYAEQTEIATKIARGYAAKIDPDGDDVATQTAALLIASICVADACGLERDMLLEGFVQLIKTVKYPAGSIR